MKIQYWPAAAAAATAILAVVSFIPLIAEQRGAPMVLPMYPMSAIAKNIQGKAVVNIIADPNGGIDTISLVSATSPPLGAAAMNFAKMWDFDPAGKDVLRSARTVTYEFRLDSNIEGYRTTFNPAINTFTILANPNLATAIAVSTRHRH